MVGHPSHKVVLGRNDHRSMQTYKKGARYARKKPLSFLKGFASLLLYGYTNVDANTRMASHVASLEASSGNFQTMFLTFWL